MSRPKPIRLRSVLRKPATALESLGVQGSKAETRNDPKSQSEPGEIGNATSAQVVADEFCPAPGYIPSFRIRSWAAINRYFAS
jgi:hypothetical protein